MISSLYGNIYRRKRKRKKSDERKQAPGPRKLTAEEKRRAAMPYLEYLQTPYWRAVRRAKLEQSGGRCFHCGKTENLEIHHVSYAHRGYELGHLSDLVVYCAKCHGWVHSLRR